eukprot:gnl/Hemi2/19123_TR6340_c0_g2_i1.p1 gnl/Hemi2/19123_TR6340_c0_g2~~gnl/Hemi2/19123_TR6340_c0_g2_i1.p1  ORF type:complete len:414 (-),score=72.01 gnl/Hemi2/19123_TR6340_c0_g2_i1:39-1280(-)
MESVLRALIHIGNLPDKTQLRNLFDQYDLDHDGKLDRTELNLMLKDTYCQVIDSSRANPAYLKNAKSVLDTERGKKLLAGGVEDLLRLKGTDCGGTLTFDELLAQLDQTHSQLEKRGQYWRLAPLCELKLNACKYNVQTPEELVKAFICGSAAGGFAKTFGSPFSRVTIILQTQTERRGTSEIFWHIYQRDGPVGFFRGNGVDVLRSIPHGGLNFLCYEYLKAAMLPYKRSASGLDVRMLAGGLSGVCACFVTYPLDVIRTHLCVQEQKLGVWRTGEAIYRQEGFKAFYRGLGMACCQIFPNLAISYSMYETIRNQLSSNGHSGVFPSIFSGVLSGTLAGTVTFPVDLVMRRMMVRKGPAAGAYQCTRDILRKHGWRGLFRGLGPQMAKSVPTCAGFFAAYDYLKHILDVDLK